MKADQMQPRTGNQRGESLYEFQRRHHDMGRALSIGCLQGEHHLPGPVECKPFIGDSGAGDVAAQVLRPRRARQAPMISKSSTCRR